MEQKEAPRDYKSEFSADETGYYSTHVNHEYNAIKNKKNAVVYKFENGEELFAYRNGYFISKKDGVMYLKTAEGKEITNTVSLGVNGFGGLNSFGREEMKKLLADGYILAYKLDETSSDETYQIGVLKVDGTWLVPLAADNPLLTCGNFVSEDYVKEGIKYAGEGILFVDLFSASTDGECVLYDINISATKKCGKSCNFLNPTSTSVSPKPPSRLFSLSTPARLPRWRKTCLFSTSPPPARTN